MHALKRLADRYREAVVDPKADEEVRQALLDNPLMNGSSLYNFMMGRGLAIIRPDTLSGKNKNEPRAQVSPTSDINEALQAFIGRYPADSMDYKGRPEGVLASETDNVSGAPTGVLAEKEIALRCETKFMEGAQPSRDALGPTRFRAVLIEEGLGNLGDGFYYTKEALKSMAPILEGKKIYADHPSASEDVDRPERSVRDVGGHYENVEYMESEGRGRLEADAIVLPDEPYRWMRALMRHAADYGKTHPDKSFVGLSINAMGDSKEQNASEFLEQHSIPESAMPKLRKAIETGLDKVRVVSEITDAVSVDLVTEAGAGGKILEILESEKGNMKTKKKVKESDGEEKPKDEEAPKEGEEKPTEEPTSEGDDAASDAEMIKAMVKKYMGDDDAEKEEVCEMAREALEACKEMGMDGEEAEKAAMTQMKLARHMAMKKEKTEAEEQPEESSEEPKEETDVKESSRLKSIESENVKLKGEVAKLTERANLRDVADHTEKLCRESKLPRAVTKKFKEAVKEAKSVEEIDKKWNLFMEGYKAFSESGSDDEPLAISPEKMGEGDGESVSAIDLSDCTNQ